MPTPPGADDPVRGFVGLVTPYAGCMRLASSVTDAVALLEAEGFGSGLSIVDGHALCAACELAHAVPDIVVRETFRFEGDTDPGDEEIVLGVECPVCGTRGIIVSAFGPDASTELIELVAHLGTPSARIVDGMSISRDRKGQ
jgi:hypothetical protein